jgi:bacteriocin-like protein
MEKIMSKTMMRNSEPSEPKRRELTEAELAAISGGLSSAFASAIKAIGDGAAQVARKG